ncbi:FAD synthetase [Mesorhizobium loti R88b]|uniref:FAD synthase n=1 Tax=Mesorhizobium loti R88b TaxID=935548 RepID=A0A6M7WQ24_RHILI|nr:FAD synthetase [Mesorhizobium loti R88b]
MKCHVAGALRLPRSVIAIGTFDGVHRGHQKVLGNAVNAARRLNCPAVVYTFDLPPKALFKGTSVLTAPDEKVRRLAALGLDHCILAKFDRTYASRTAEAFLSELAALNPAEIWVGEDFRFGADRKGDVATLAAHFPVRLTNAVRCHDGDVISSTRIRTLMEEGDTLAAEILVGHFSDCHDATELWRVT